MDRDLLANMETGRAAVEAEGFENNGLASHVLATCKLSERALERDGRGAFTQALLTLLRDSTIRHHGNGVELGKVCKGLYLHVMSKILTSWEIFHQALQRKLFDFRSVKKSREVSNSMTISHKLCMFCQLH
jgi:hypothetical protein